MSPTGDSTLATLRRELAEARAERDAGLARETATTEILQAISSSRADDLALVFDTMLERALRLCEASLGALWNYDGERFHALALRGGSPAFIDFVTRTPLAMGPESGMGRVVLGEPFVHFVDVARAEHVQEPGVAHTLLQVSGARTWLVVPLRKDDITVGVLTIFRQVVRPFTDKQIALVQNFAAQAVIAMENTRLLTETREALEQQTATAEVLRVISASPTDLQPTFEAIAARAAAVCGAASGGVFRFDGALVHLGAYYGGAQDELNAIQRAFPMPPGNGSITARAVMAKEIVHSTNVGEDDGGVLAALAEVFRTVMSVPMLRDGNVLGTITVTRRQVQPFSAAQIELLKTFADQAVIAIENVRLFNETREALEQQTATAEVLGVINSSPGELRPVFDAILEKAMSLCDAAMGFMTTYDGERFAAAALRGIPAPLAEYFAGGMDQPQPGESHWRLLEGEDLVHNLDQKDEDAYRSGSPLRRAVVDLGGIRTALVVALRRNQTLLGTLTLYRKEVRHFTGAQIALVQSFAAQAVIAMENARLLTETRQRTEDLEEALEYQTATSDVLKVISRSTVDLQPVLQTVVETAARLCEADMAFLLRREGDAYRSGAAVGFSKEYQEYLASHPLPADSGSTTGRVALEKRVVHISDCMADPEYTHTQSVELAGQRTSLGVPLLREGDIIGVIVLARRRVEPFTERQIELVRTFADQAVIAMENARLLGDLRERTEDLQQSLEYQTATSDVLKIISRSTFDLQPVLDTLVETAVLLCEGQMAFIYRRDGELYHLVASSGFTPEYHAFMASQPQRAGLGSMVGRVAMTARPVHIIDAANDPEYTWTEARERGGYRTMLGVPLLREGEPIGLISIVRAIVKPFTDTQIELMTAFADQAGIAIENARLIGELREARDAAETAFRDLQAAQSNLVQAQKMAALGQLTAGIAHEIKNPLNFVNNFASLSVELLDELRETAAPALVTLDDDKRADVDDTMELLTGNLEKIAEHGKRADNIVRSMLEHSRGVSGERREVDLNGVIEEALNLAYHGARAQDQGFNVTLERDYAESLRPIELAPQEITRVFLNLFGNGFYAVNKRARDHRDGSFRPVVTVRTREEGGAIEVHVRDNGTGIPAEIKDKLFQPFFTTKPTGEGTGLGLSISYDIITQQHGGTITVESEPGAYTEFTVRLPRR